MTSSKPDTPCVKCGKLLYSSPTSAPKDQRTCRACRNELPSRQARTCEICQAEYRYTYFAQRTCGRMCGAALQRRQSVTSKPGPVCRRCGGDIPGGDRQRLYCSQSCARPSQPKLERDLSPRRCISCSVEFVPPPSRGPTRKFCSRRCGRRAARGSRHDHKQRARHHGVAYEPIRLADVYARDRWTCGICGGRIDPGLAHPHPMSKSIDHVVPMVRGGGHVMSNVQAAHFMCNVRKRDALPHGYAV